VNDGALAIEASGLAKTFGKTRAVCGVDLAVRTGTVYGFLGPNGAGKTTTIRMLATLLRPDEGTARVLGHDIVTEADAVRSRVSLTGQFASVDEDLTGSENLVLLARLLGYSRAAAKERAGDLLEAFGLTEAAGRQVKNYSGGMRRRLDIMASIVVTPELIFLDEPTTGLDPRSRNQVWDIVRALVGEGTTVLLTTQYLDEADQLADRIAVIDQGTIIAEGTSGELKASVGSGTVHIRLHDATQRGDAERLLSQALGVAVRLESDPAALSAQLSALPSVNGAGERVAHAVSELSRSGITVTDFGLGQPSLDEVFFSLTGHPAEDDTTSNGNGSANGQGNGHGNEEATS
jgi:ABC-2 type transport system ATP-binding protein